MSDERRTPNEHTVKSIFVQAHPFALSTSHEDRRSEFDRFIAKVRADALREVAGDWGKHLDATDSSYSCPESWLMARAERIEEEA